MLTALPARLLFAASLVCLATFSARADDNWRQPAGTQWSITGGDWYNSRYSTLNAINLQTIARLGGDYYCRATDLFEMKRPTS